MQTFGRYRIEQSLARSEDGETFSAFDERLQHPVVLRVLPAGVAEDVAERFLRACAVAAGLVHPRLVPVRDFGRVEGRAFVDLRVPEGDALSALLARGPLPGPAALDVTAQVAEALDAGHAAGLVHGALDPGVVVVRGDGCTSLFGFGFGAAGDPPADRHALARLLEDAITGVPPVAALPPALAAVTRAEHGSGAALVAAGRAALPGGTAPAARPATAPILGRRGLLATAAGAVLVLVVAVVVGVTRSPSSPSGSSPSGPAAGVPDAAAVRPVTVPLTGGVPERMLLSADGTKLFVAAYRSGTASETASLTVVDLASRTVTAKVELNSRVEAMANRADGGVIVTGVRKAQIVDPVAGTARDVTLPAPPRYLTRDGRVVYVSSDDARGSSVVGVDVASGRILSSTPDRPVEMVGCDPLAAPDGSTLYCQTVGTTLNVIDLTGGRDASFTIDIEPTRVDLAPDSRHLVVTSTGEPVEIVDLATRRPTANVEIDGGVAAVAVGRRAYLASGNSHVVQALDLDGGRPPATVATNISYPYEMAISADERTAYLADEQGLTIVDLAAS